MRNGLPNLFSSWSADVVQPLLRRLAWAKPLIFVEMDSRRYKSLVISAHKVRHNSILGYVIGNHLRVKGRGRTALLAFLDDCVVFFGDNRRIPVFRIDRFQERGLEETSRVTHVEPFGGSFAA